MSGNREYKSDVFSMLFEDKENALQLYNALNGSDYENPEEIEICKLDRGVLHHLLTVGANGHRTADYLLFAIMKTYLVFLTRIRYTDRNVLV